MKIGILCSVRPYMPKPSPPIVGCRLMTVPLPSQSAIVSITPLAKAALDYLLLGSKSFRQTRVG
jgi:hypothetical protein